MKDDAAGRDSARKCARQLKKNGCTSFLAEFEEMGLYVLIQREEEDDLLVVSIPFINWCIRFHKSSPLDMLNAPDLWLHGRKPYPTIEKLVNLVISEFNNLK